MKDPDLIGEAIREVDAKREAEIAQRRQSIIVGDEKLLALANAAHSALKLSLSGHPSLPNISGGIQGGGAFTRRIIVRATGGDLDITATAEASWLIDENRGKLSEINFDVQRGFEKRTSFVYTFGQAPGQKYIVEHDEVARRIAAAIRELGSTI